MKPETITKIIRPVGLITILITYITICVLSLFVLPLDREGMANMVIDSMLTLSITWSSLYIASRGVEKSIQISRNQGKVD